MIDLIKQLETNVKDTKATYIAMDHRTDLRDYARTALAYMDTKAALLAELEK